MKSYSQITLILVSAFSFNFYFLFVLWDQSLSISLLYGFGFMLLTVPFIFVLISTARWLKFKLFGYGSCFKCGAKRETWWKLSCDKCYDLKFPQASTTRSDSS